MILMKCWDTLVVHWNRSENFFATTKVKHWLGCESIFTSDYSILALKMENFMKISKKSLAAHVSDKIIRTTRRTTIPIDLEDRYDPWQVLWYRGCVMEPRRKFFQVDWSRIVFSLWSLFDDFHWILTKILLKILLNPSEHPKMHCSSRFCNY